jgi:Ti-type conjugative transfer relaxase TraA
MLSIGKVGGGQASPSYYVEHVAQGAEDYYAGKGEARGQWHGKGAEGRGLSGPVADDDFLTLLTADPGPGKTVLGYDLTFSAPKSVSLLFGLGDDSLSGQVREAHDEAVRQALDYVEQYACWTRRGAGGRTRLQGGGLTVATFRHRTSRAGDPQLHTHSVVANATAAAGATTALDGQALYAHARTAGYLYQAALRDRMTRTVGVEWRPVVNGMAEIDGFDPEVLRAFSRRSQDIEEHLEQRGVRTMKGARVVKLETRRAKTYDVPVARLRDEWAARASELGLAQDALNDVLDRRAPGRPAHPTTDDLAEDLIAPDGVTRQASTFDRRDVLRDLAGAPREGATPRDLEVLADAWLASDDVVRLEAGAWRQHLGGARFSTVEMLELERELVDIALARRDSATAVAPPGTVDQVLARSRQLADEQTNLISSITTSGHGVEVVNAAAGTGKTRALGAARDVWERSDINVYGCALAARAAVELESLAGIDSTTVARLLNDIDHGYGLRTGSVLIVDEAGMVGTRSLARLAAHASDTQSKLVLVGDDHQLPEIDAGGAFRGLAKRLGAHELREVRRQDHDWDRAALNELRDGRIDRWTDAYRDHGRIVVAPTSRGVRQALVDDWWEAARGADRDAVMVAHRRADVAELNALARERMHRDGRLGDDEVATGGRTFAVGDMVVARRNDRRAELVNGTRATVRAIDLADNSLTIDDSDGTMRNVPAAYLAEGWLDHGYALTAHAAQGATVDRAFVLGSDELYREWGYTALTRHREEARFYVVSTGTAERALPGLEPEEDQLVDEVTSMLQQSRRKDMAIEHVDRAADPIAREARERLGRLKREREELGRLQRGRRKELDDLIRRQEAALERQPAYEQPRRAIRMEPASAEVRVDPDELRHALAVPSEAVVATVGERPAAFAERERWCRAVSALVGERADLTPSAIEPTMDDTGLEL